MVARSKGKLATGHCRRSAGISVHPTSKAYWKQILQGVTSVLSTQNVPNVFYGVAVEHVFCPFWSRKAVINDKACVSKADRCSFTPTYKKVDGTTMNLDSFSFVAFFFAQHSLDNLWAPSCPPKWRVEYGLVLPVCKNQIFHLCHLLKMQSIGLFVNDMASSDSHDTGITSTCRFMILRPSPTPYKFCTLSDRA